MAKYIELHENSFKTSKISLHPMAKMYRIAQNELYILKKKFSLGQLRPDRDHKQKPANQTERERTDQAHPSSEGLEGGRQGIVLQLEQVRGFTVHLKTVMVAVKLHRTHKEAVARHHIGQLDRGGERE